MYIPKENLENIEASARDKDLVQRLEAAVIHWTRQIKEVVGLQDNSMELNENAGPLAEIQFWRARQVILSFLAILLSPPASFYLFYLSSWFLPSLTHLFSLSSWFLFLSLPSYFPPSTFLLPLPSLSLFACLLCIVKTE